MTELDLKKSEVETSDETLIGKLNNKSYTSLSQDFSAIINKKIDDRIEKAENEIKGITDDEPENDNEENEEVDTKETEEKEEE